MLSLHENHGNQVVSIIFHVVSPSGGEPNRAPTSLPGIYVPKVARCWSFLFNVFCDTVVKYREFCVINSLTKKCAELKHHKIDMIVMPSILKTIKILISKKYFNHQAMNIMMKLYQHIGTYQIE